MPMPDPSIARFRRAVASAYTELEGRRQEVNDLNVFPVADGDTGDNMAMTLSAVLSELDRINGQHIDEVGRTTVVDAVARAALLGARGNSGVILSQIVRGAAEELASRPGELVDPILVAAALAKAADAAYDSVRPPEASTTATGTSRAASASARTSRSPAAISPRRASSRCWRRSATPCSSSATPRRSRSTCTPTTRTGPSPSSTRSAMYRASTSP